MMTGSAPSRSRGFTLLEILVVMTLLSVIMLALGSALRSIGQTERGVDRRLERSDEFRVAVEFLRSALGRISGNRVPNALRPGGSPYQFQAAANSLDWIGILPARFGAGGRSYFHLAIEPTNQAGFGPQALALRYAPYTGAAEFPDWTQAQVLYLVGNTSALSLTYADARQDPPTWTSDWAPIDHLPDRIAVNVQTPAGPWPELIVPMRQLPQASGDGSGFVIGGT